MDFSKYRKRGPGYHWNQVSRSPLKHNSFVSARIRIVADLVKKVGRRQHILDIGCGDGVLAFHCARYTTEKVYGVDTSPEAIAYASQKCTDLQMTFSVSSAYQLPFQDGQFDTVVSSEVIEHLDNPEQMLKEISRVWNRNGVVVITTPVRLTKHPLDSEHVQEFFEEDFQLLIRSFFPTASFMHSHPIFWTEFQRKLLLRKPFGKLLLNILEITTGFNPFLITSGWRHYVNQIAVIRS